MAFFKRKKKTTENQKSNSMADAWIEGKINADDVIILASLDFLRGAAWFYDDIRRAKEELSIHNEVAERYQGYVNDIAAGKEYPEKGMDLMLLSLHKNTYNSVAEVLRTRNALSVGMGFIQLEALRQCEMLRPDATLDISKEKLLKFCMFPEIRENSLKKLKETNHVKEEATVEDLPTPEQLSFYYDACALYLKLFHEENAPGASGKIADMFAANGLIMMPDPDGRYRVVEEDIFADYVEIDYKGVV